MSIPRIALAVAALALSAAAAAQAPSLAAPAAPVPRSRVAPNVRCAKTETLVRLASTEVERLAGLRTEKVEVRPLAPTLIRQAEVQYDANRYARLSPRAPGVVAEVLKDLGEPVRRGETLAVVDSPGLGEAKADLLRALETARLWETTASRERELLRRGIGVERESLEAETRLAESRIDLAHARQRLRNLGLSAEQVARVEDGGDTSSLLSIAAPFDGTVVERSAVLGETAQPGVPLLAVADTRSMWLLLDLREADLAVVRPGQQVQAVLDGLPGRVFGARLTWVAMQVDPRTRTIKARAEADNGEGLLRAHMFGRAEVRVREGGEGVVAPREAVQWEGCCNVVFTRVEGDAPAFRPVKVHLGAEVPGGFEVLEGLRGGEHVVTEGSFLLKTEILKGSIGAGCCEVDHLAK